MFSYTVSMEPDEKVFKDACALIDSKVSYLKKERLLTDVDGSLIQVYDTANGKIKVLSDYDVYAVYVESSVDLDEVLKSHAKEYGLDAYINRDMKL